MATFQNNKKKDWFSCETRLVFKEVFKDGSRNSAAFNMELLAAIGNGRVFNQGKIPE